MTCVQVLDGNAWEQTSRRVPPPSLSFHRPYQSEATSNAKAMTGRLLTAAAYGITTMSYNNPQKTAHGSLADQNEQRARTLMPKVPKTPLAGAFPTGSGTMAISASASALLGLPTAGARPDHRGYNPEAGASPAEGPGKVVLRHLSSRVFPRGVPVIGVCYRQGYRY